MKLTVPPIVVTTATHTLVPGNFKLRRCACGTHTTGQVKESATGRVKPFCQTCAVKAGFK